MEDTKTKSLLIKEKIGLCQKSLGPNVYKNLFKEGVDPNITAYIDSEILRSFNDKAKIKVAILVEPRTVIPKIYDWMSANHNLFNNKKIEKFIQRLKVSQQFFPKEE